MKLLILDRDGVINKDSRNFIKSPAEWRALPGSLRAIARFCQAGWKVAVVTNQSGVGRGLFSARALSAIHRRMTEELRHAGGNLAGIFVCPHTPDDGCDCRKPGTGMLEDFARRFSVELDGVPLVGDSERDLDAARAVGARPILVRTGNGKKTENALGEDTDVAVYDDLAAVADALLEEQD